MAAGSIQNKLAPNCTITAMDINTGVVTATENTTSKSFQFKLNDATQLKSLNVGKGVYANFAANVVSLEGLSPDGTILGTASTSSAASAATGAAGGMQNTVGPVRSAAAQPPSASTSSGGPASKGQGTSPLSQGAGSHLPHIVPLYYTQLVYLDVLPIGIIYVPPGDPSANPNSSATPSIIPIQTFSSIISTSTTKSTVTLTTGNTQFGQDVSISIDINGPAPTDSTTTNTQTTDSQTFMKTLPPANGPGGYPGLNDRVVFYVNPTYDVTYLGGWLHTDTQKFVPANPVQITSILPHKLDLHSDPNLYQWVPCAPLIFELQAYVAGDHQQSDTQCLNHIQPPSPTLAGDVITSIARHRPQTRQTPAEKLIQLDPMIAGNQGPVGNPTSVLSDTTGRFQPIALHSDPTGHPYPWSYCNDSPIWGFDDTISVTQTNSTSTKTIFTGGISLSLNPVAIGSLVLKAAGGPDLPVPGSAVTTGDEWEIDTTVTNSNTTETKLNTKGQFGGGTVPNSQATPCNTNNAPAFLTTMYYDWVNHTVLFSTVKDTGSAVSGSTAPGAHIVFTPVGGGRPMVVRSDSTGQFQSKLPPGNYTYRVEDSAGHALTTTPLSIAVKPNEPVRLPPITFDGKASNNLGASPSGATGLPSEAQTPAIGVSAPTGSPGTVRDEKTKKPAATTQQSSSSSNANQRNTLGNEDSSNINASEGSTEGAIRGVTAAPPPGSSGAMKSTSEAAISRSSSSLALLPPRIRALAVTSPVTGGVTAPCSVQLERPVLKTQNPGVVVYLAVQNPPADPLTPGRGISVPEHVSVPPGSAIVHFDCQTYPVNATWPQMISARIGIPFAQGRVTPPQLAIPLAQGSSQDVTNATLTVLPAVLSSVVVQPGTVTGGYYQSADGVIHGLAQGTVQFSGKVAAARPRLGSGTGTGTAGVVVTLSSSDPTVNVPNAIEVATGDDSATFGIMTTPVLQDKAVEIKATSRNLEDVKALPNITKMASLIVLRLLPTAVSLDQQTVNSGSSTTGIVTMSGPAPSGGMDIQLTSLSPAVATVPPSVHYSPSLSSTDSNKFTIQTHSVQKDTSVDIKACSGIPPDCKSASLTVLAPQPHLYVNTVTFQDANGAIQTPVAGQQFTMCYNVVNSGNATSGSTTLTVTMSNTDNSSTQSWSETIPAIDPGTGATVCISPPTLSQGVTYDFNGYIPSVYAADVQLGPF
jgi:hypothetical protein